MPTIVSTFSEEGRFVNNPLDVFVTPFSFAKAALEVLNGFEPELEPYTVLDPGCGNGVWGRAVKKAHPSAHVTGVDLRYLEMAHGYDEIWLGQDFLTWQTDRKFNFIVGNPPYSSKKDKRLAEHFVRKAQSLLGDYGMMMLLLKHDFSGGIERATDLFSSYHPLRIFKPAERIPFMEETLGKRTNTTEYALYLWKKRDNWSDTTYHWFSWNQKGGVKFI